MEGVVEKPIDTEITTDDVLAIAKDSGGQFGEIKKKYPITANALLFRSKLYPDQIMNDPRVVTAITIVDNYESGTEQNAINLVNSIPEEVNPQVSLNDLMGGLNEFKKITSSSHPDDLYRKVSEQMSLTIGRLMSDELRSGIREPLMNAKKHPDKYNGETRQLLIAYSDFSNAIGELAPNLSKLPSEIEASKK